MRRLDANAYEKNFKGFFIRDCVVRRKDMFYFVLEEDLGENPSSARKKKTRTRVVFCFDEPTPEASWGYQEFTGMVNMLASTSLIPKQQFVGVSLSGFVYVVGSGVNELEDDLKGVHSKQLKAAKAPVEAYLLRGGIGKLATIDGLVFGCGLGRTIIQREGRNQWKYFTDLPKDKSVTDDTGFSGIDGFSKNNIYAAGGKGDVWRFDGVRWRQVTFPSNMDLYTVCCGGDGQVYIGAEQGNIFKGVLDNWKRVHKDEMALPFRDMVWYQDKLWCTSDYGLWVMENDKLQEADVPSWVQACSGNLSVGDGVLLLAGLHGAALYDGTSWQKIIDYDDLA